MMERIESETMFVLKLLKDILLLPLTLILVLARKKQFIQLFQPIKDFFRFFFEAKFIAVIILINLTVFILQIFYFSPDTVENYIWRPSYLLSLNLLPMLTAQFLHTGWTHVLWNMAFLFALGRVVERKLGILKTAIIYFVSGIVSLLFYSAVMLFIFKSDSSGLGASAAIAGIMAAALLLDPLYITFIAFIPMPVLFVVLIKIYSDITGFFSLSDNAGGNLAHIGGYLSILLSMFLLSKQDRGQMKKGLIISVIVLIIIAIGYYLLLKFNIIELIKK